MFKKNGYYESIADRYDFGTAFSDTGVVKSKYFITSCYYSTRQPDHITLYS